MNKKAVLIMLVTMWGACLLFVGLCGYLYLEVQKLKSDIVKVDKKKTFEIPVDLSALEREKEVLLLRAKHCERLEKKWRKLYEQEKKKKEQYKKQLDQLSQKEK